MVQVDEDQPTMHESDRGILIGANGTGKSTLAEYVLRHFRKEYPHARILVLDTKPRWRGALLADGTKPKRLYAPLAKGDTIPGAISLQRMDDWSLAWHPDLNKSNTVIAQRMQGTHADNLTFQVAALEKFFSTQRASRPSLAYIDEGMDFFGTNGNAKGGSDIVQRCYRAGRERGLATLAGFQRPVGINQQCLTEVNWAALFRINFVKDVQKMYDMGWPQGDDGMPPTYNQQHAFRLWREGRPVAPLYRIKPKG